MNEKALFDFSYGVYILSSKDNGRDVGCIANSAMQVTSESPSFAVSVNRENFTNECIKKCGLFALSILSEKCDPAVIGTFGFKSSRDTDKFKGVESIEKSGVAVLSAAADTQNFHFSIPPKLIFKKVVSFSTYSITKDEI